ncbi:glycosyltransferase family 39 protein [Streptomyces sp. E11-3]|uniref:glycosyltransferase family 39 protein n=1 Tax=Streptomyces sp. E11-3 TaxID=3110112 RepID=UPI00397FE0B9
MDSVRAGARANGAGGQPPQLPPLPPFAARPVLAPTAVLAGVLTALSGRYGFHRDELYFLAAGDHPAWGYVDQPPLTPLIARAATEFFGDSLTGLRVASTLAYAAIVLVAAAVARELGCGRRAQLLAALGAALSGQVLAVGQLVATASFDLLAWLVISLLVLRLLRTGDGRWWLAIGAAVGLGLQNKYLVALLVLALLPAMWVTGPRQVLRSRWLPAGAVLALAVAAPNLWWQAAQGWPQLTVATGISGDDGAENRLLFVPQQIVYLSPFFVPVWIAGWLRLWRDPALRWARAFTVAYPLLCVLVLAVGGKAYYALPPLLVLLAAGCEPVVDWLGRGRRAVRRSAVVAAVAVTAAVNAVVTLPVLPPSALSFVNEVNREQGEQIGWPELVATAADGWRRIPAADRSRAVLVAQNYGEAGALARFGPEHGLPEPYSGHMGYADWGPPPESANGPVLLVRQSDAPGIDRHFTGCRQVGRVDNGHGLENEEQHAAVLLCSGTSAPWSALWPELRRFY